MLTGDKSIIDLEFIVQYKVKSAKEYVFNVRNPDETLRDAAEAAMRMEIGDRGIDDALTSGREEIEIAVLERLQQIVDGYDAGLLITAIKLQDTRPPSQVEYAFDKVVAAKQEKTTKVNNAWAEYNKVIPRAKGKADNMLRTAEAYAVERVNEATGNANKFNELFDKYKDDKEITRIRMYLETLKEIMPGFKEKIIIEDDLGNSIFKLLDLNHVEGKK